MKSQILNPTTTPSSTSSAVDVACRVCEFPQCENLGRPVYCYPPRVAGVDIEVNDLSLFHYRCPRCTYRFVHPGIPDERLMDCYARASSGHWRTDDAVAELRYYPRKKLLLQQYAPGTRVLDFGCYDGGFLAYLGREYERYGIEPSKAAAQVAAARGIVIVGPTVESVDVHSLPPLDVIVMFDVLEHLSSPVDTLGKLSRLLRPGGIILAETGNTDADAYRRYGHYYRYCGIVEHVGFFNERSLRETASRAGLMLAHFELSRHDANAHPSPLAGPTNVIYLLLRAFDRAGLPLPTRARGIARGPFPRTTACLQDHFLAVLRKN